MLALEWLFIALGMFAGSAQAAQGPALMVFPLTSVSSAYVPIETMPGWMQAIAENQPITHMVDAVRALTQSPAAEAVLGHQASYYVHALAALDGGHRGGLRTAGYTEEASPGKEWVSTTQSVRPPGALLFGGVRVDDYARAERRCA